MHIYITYVHLWNHRSTFTISLTKIYLSNENVTESIHIMASGTINRKWAIKAETR